MLEPTVSDPKEYLAATTTTAAITNPWLRSIGRTRVSFTITLTADTGAARVGQFVFYGSDDPQCIEDNAAGTTDAKKALLTPPSGSLHGSGGGATLNGTDIEVNATAGTLLLNFENPPAYIRLDYTSDSAGVDGTAQAYVSMG